MCPIYVFVAGGIVFCASAYGAEPPLTPDPTLTPGAVLTTDATKVCVPGYSHTVRDVPEAEKRKVYAEYHIVQQHPKQFEVDHLISLELGGSNDIKNLWPQSYETPVWNAHVKDALEDTLHAKVCHHELDLAVAQQAIAKDWRAAYCKYVRPNTAPCEGLKP